MTAEATAKPRKTRESFGKLGKKGTSYYPSYVGPDAKRHTAPQSFKTVTDARAWLAAQRQAIDAGEWKPSVVKTVRGHFVAKRSQQREFLEYARNYVEKRTTPRGKMLAPKTLLNYKWHVETNLQAFHSTQISFITAEDVEAWWASMIAPPKEDASSDKPSKGPALTTASQAYVLLRGIMEDARSKKLIGENPVNIRGAAKLRTGKVLYVPTDLEVEKVLAKLDDAFRALFLTETWGPLRFGEVTELRRGDVIFRDRENANGVLVPEAHIAIRRGVAYTPEDGYVVGDPKSEAGKRDVVLPEYASKMLHVHVTSDEHPAFKPGDLLWTALTNRRKHMSYAVYYSRWSDAITAADVPYFNPHMLRHYGSTAMAKAGATLRDLQTQSGHSSPAAAMRYQSSAQERRAELMQDAAKNAAASADKERRLEQLRKQRESLEAEMRALEGE